MLGRWTMDTSPMFIGMDVISRLFSPYDLNPANVNPLRRILEEQIDFERLKASPIRLFITATNVRTGRGRVFRNAEISPDVLLASACLPTLFQAIEIDGEHYWDGGYSGNPTLTPLVRELKSDDTILVPINPVERPGTPQTVSFNAVALKELRMIALLRKVADPGSAEGAAWAKMRVHMVPNPLMATLGYSSKLNAEWDFLSMLKAEGRNSAAEFLDRHGYMLGVQSSIDLDVLLEGV
jgi:NTE family protein